MIFSISRCNNNFNNSFRLWYFRNTKHLYTSFFFHLYFIPIHKLLLIHPFDIFCCPYLYYFWICLIIMNTSYCNTYVYIYNIEIYLRYIERNIIFFMIILLSLVGALLHLHIYYHHLNIFIYIVYLII